jgi:hypothetical protein
VTQLPAVFGMVCDTISHLLPSVGASARQSFAHHQLARGIMREHRAVFGVGAEAGFDEGRFVITDAYTGGSDALKKTYDVAPKHRDEQYNAFCRRELDYGRGDDVLQLGRVDLAGARRYLQREVPAGSMPALLAASAVLALQRLVLPVMHWMDDTRTFGSLRPRVGSGR